MEKSISSYNHRGELIDTCWDVNLVSSCCICKSHFRINRYMLGCKCMALSHDSVTRYRINRYMLGCKCLYNIGGKDRQTRINRYMLGCKWDYMGQV